MIHFKRYVFYVMSFNKETYILCFSLFDNFKIKVIILVEVFVILCTQSADMNTYIYINLFYDFSS